MIRDHICFAMNSLQSSEPNQPAYISQAISILGELLARGNSMGTAYLTEGAEAAALAAILEVKVSLTLTNFQLKLCAKNI